MNPMKVLGRLRFLFLFLPGLLAGGRAGAQLFGLSVSNSPAPVFPGEMFSYTINVTNLGAIGDVAVTNFLPPAVGFVSGSSSFALATISSSPGLVVFDLGPAFTAPLSATLTLNVVATNFGPLTNIVTVGLQGVANFLAATNITFVMNPSTSLGLGITPPSVAVVANDWMTYSVSVTNTGSNAANNVVVANALPPGVGLTPANPASPPFTFSNNVMVFNLGTFPPGASQTLFFSVQPTNTGASNNIILPFIAGAGASNATNVTVTNDITILPFDTSQLVAVNFSAMTYDPQNALLEQTLQLSNIGTNQVAAARVIVSGLTNVLYNAVGTNNGNPFVQYGNALPPGQSVLLLMQYFVPTRLPITVANSSYAAVPVTLPNLTPPPGAPFSITLVTNIPGKGLLIEFQSIPNRSYTVLYSDNPAMTNSLQAQPSIVAQADRTQWIDNGPPNTISPPTNGMRFYSVLLNP